MSDVEKIKTKMVGRWYFGGFASAGAVFVTHPLDLLKVIYINNVFYGYFLIIKIVNEWIFKYFYQKLIELNKF